MNFTTTRRDKIRILLTALGLLTGILFMWLVETSRRNNPPPDADIGGGMIYVLGMAMAYANGIGLTASLLYICLRNNMKRLSTARIVTFVIMAGIVLLGWYLIIGAETMQKNSYNREIRTRYGTFVKYQAPVRTDAISGQSEAVSVRYSENKSSTVTIDAHDCSPGLAKVTTSSSTTYFAISGVARDEYLRNSGRSVCEMYIGTQTAGQAWDGLLYAKCIIRLSNSPAENSLQLRLTDSGIQFDTFRSNCQDSRTGVVPDDL